MSWRNMMRLHQIMVLTALAALAGCQPDFGQPLSLVTGTRILAVRGQPAEAAPGALVSFDVLAASPDGTIAAPPLSWALCDQPKPLTDNNVVADACLGALPPIGAPAPTTITLVPDDACRLFGPDTPPSTPGQPALRPRDPDATGGYYQPIRATWTGTVAFGLERLRCNLAGASLAIAEEFQMRYTSNQNPQLTPLVAADEGQPVALDALPAGRKITFTVGWTAASPESYPVLDPASQTLVDHREAMRVSWFATSGAFAEERTGRDETDPALTTSDDWTAPANPGPAHLWVVLRDSRGGVDFASYQLTVK
jgi:hypothetical protein